MLFRLKYVGYEFVELHTYEEIEEYLELPTMWTDIEWEPVEVDEADSL